MTLDAYNSYRLSPLSFIIHTFYALGLYNSYLLSPLSSIPSSRFYSAVYVMREGYARRLCAKVMREVMRAAWDMCDITFACTENSFP